MNTRDRTVTVAVISGLVMALLGLCIGTAAGGVAGFMLGRQSSVLSIMPMQDWLDRAPERVVPVLPSGPNTPELPFRPASGAIISRVVQDTPADQAGLQAGDVIVRVDNTPVDSRHPLADVVASYAPGDQVNLEVWRSGATREIQVTLGSNPDGSRTAYLGIFYLDLPAAGD